MAVFFVFVTKADERATVVGAGVRAGLEAMQADNRARLTQISRSYGQIFQRGQRWPLRPRILIAR
jgi:hypothetical protein